MICKLYLSTVDSRLWSIYSWVGPAWPPPMCSSGAQSWSPPTSKFQVYPPPGQIVRGDRGVVHVDCHPVLCPPSSAPLPWVTGHQAPAASTLYLFWKLLRFDGKINLSIYCKQLHPGWRQWRYVFRETVQNCKLSSTIQCQDQCRVPIQKL